MGSPGQPYLKDELHIDRPIVLLGCASHRLSLAVKWFCSTDNNEDYERLIKLLHDLMIALKTSKNRYKLAAKTSLCPEVESDTRWDSIGEMISKGAHFKPAPAPAAAPDASRRIITL